jgi:hypothetical protein
VHAKEKRKKMKLKKGKQKLFQFFSKQRKREEVKKSYFESQKPRSHCLTKMQKQTRIIAKERIQRACFKKNGSSI